jgi:integrase
VVTTTHHSIDIGPYRKIRLRPTPNARGYYEIWYCDADRDYCTVKHSCKTKDYDEAKAYFPTFCDLARDEAQSGPIAKPKPTIDTLCEAWLADAARIGKHESNGYVLRPVRRLLGHHRPSDLVVNPALLRSYHSQRSGLSNWTVRREVGALQTVLRWAVEEKLIDLAELPSFTRGVIPPKGLARDRFLDRAQEQWFWDQAMAWGSATHSHPMLRASAPRLRLFVALALETAARRGAILELTWDRVDLVLGLIDYNIPGRRETKKRRVKGMPISDRLRPILEGAWQQAPKDGSGRAIGRVFDASRIEQAFRTFTAAIGMEWVTPHVLRHTWASLAAMSAVPLFDISKIMGDTLQTIEDHYAHLHPDHLRKSINFKHPAPTLRAVG